MKQILTVVISTALVLFDPLGCKPSGSPEEANTPTDVVLSATANLPSVHPGQVLRFVLSPGQTNKEYWIHFKNRTPCKEGTLLKTADGTPPLCHVKSKSGTGETSFVFQFGFGPPPQLQDINIPFNTFPCKPACE